MEAKKITQKKIQVVLKTQDVTLIHKLVSDLGLDANNKGVVFDFIIKNAKTQRVYNSAYELSYRRSCANEMKKLSSKNVKHDRLDSIQFARFQKESGLIGGSYEKKLIIGSKNIYWASPIYEHQDYNKSIALENNEKNRVLADVINGYLGFNKK